LIVGLQEAQDANEVVTRTPTAIPQSLLLAYSTTKESNEKLKFKKKESGTLPAP